MILLPVPIDRCRLLATQKGITLGSASADDVPVRDCEIQIQSSSTSSRAGAVVSGGRARFVANTVNTISGASPAYANVGIEVIGDDAEVVDNVVGDAEWPPNNVSAISVRGNGGLVESNMVADYTYGISE